MSTFGKNIKVDIFGESHGDFIGVTIENLKKGHKIDLNKLQQFVDLRKPGNNEISTARKEEDKVIVLSGLDKDFITDGSIFKAVIYNTNTRSSDYEKTVPRPSHADYPSFVKYGKIFSGGGKYSGRLTAALCIAGGVFLQMLENKGINFDGHILSIHGVNDDDFDSLNQKSEEIYKKTFPVINDKQGEQMQKEILLAKEKGDSVGGKIECKITGLPVGIGDGIFDGIDGHIANAVFGIPGVKGVEFGIGFNVCELLGSQNNDEFYFDKTVKTYTNNSGGVTGGMTNGMPLVFTVALKPTPSIYKEQRSVDLKTNENVTLKIKGRHDPCIVQRAVAPVISACAIAVYDLMEEL
ncbi:MAG: chorismate synthase [Clostridiales bacterium]|nr:chorismate synthase [Clostridiales bacterium]